MFRTSPVYWNLYVVTHVDIVFSQMFLGAFSNNFTKAINFKVVEMMEVEVNGETINEPNKSYQPQALRWGNIKQQEREIEQDYLHREECYLPVIHIDIF